MLETWLEFQRTTLLLKCEGLEPDALRSRPVESSLLSLHGLVRHMAEVERHWYTRVLLADPSAAPHWWDEAPDAELWPLEDADWDEDLATWHRECETSRANAAPLDLDHLGSMPGDTRGEHVSLRWIHVHMIEEYARHNGHADLLRELVDGAVGD